MMDVNTPRSDLRVCHLIHTRGRGSGAHGPDPGAGERRSRWGHGRRLLQGCPFPPGLPRCGFHVLLPTRPGIQTRLIPWLVASARRRLDVLHSHHLGLGTCTASPPRWSRRGTCTPSNAGSFCMTSAAAPHGAVTSARRGSTVSTSWRWRRRPHICRTERCPCPAPPPPEGRFSSSAASRAQASRRTTPCLARHGTARRARARRARAELVGDGRAWRIQAL